MNPKSESKRHSVFNIAYINSSFRKWCTLFFDLAKSEFRVTIWIVKVSYQEYSIIKVNTRNGPWPGIDSFDVKL